jgi:ATP-binding cassette, subfamily C, bacteriocin exporter
MDPADGQIHNISHEDFKKQWTGVLVIMMPGDEFKPGNEKKSTSCACGILLSQMQAFLPGSFRGSDIFCFGSFNCHFVGKLVDNVIPSGNLNLLNLLGVAMVFIILLRVILSLFQWLFVLKSWSEDRCQPYTWIFPPSDETSPVIL